MLPGFRFLFAAIVLSMSVLVFGLGAAAVLRAAHERFAESGSWRPAPDTSLAQQSEMSKPVLAMLHVDPRATSKPADAAPLIPPAQPAEIASSPEPEKTAAVDRQSPPPLETAKADTPEVAKDEVAKAENAKTEIAKTEVAPEAPKAADQDMQAIAVAAIPTAVAPQEPQREAAQPTGAVEAPPAADTKSAATDPAATVVPAAAAAPAPTTALANSPPPADEPAAVSTSEAFPLAPEQPGAPAAADPATARIATLGSPPVVIEQPTPEKAVRGEPDQSEAKKKEEAKKEREKERAEERARQRRLAARRARLAQEAAQAQLAAYPFGQANQTTQYVQPGLQPGLAGTTTRTR